jgi:tetratricopeptide (TPR) repeat protein
VEEAIADYRRALTLRPDSAEARFRLLRALFFRAKFCGGDAPERRRLSEEAREVANDGLDRLEERTGGKPGPESLSALRAAPGAAELLYWCSVAWGEWALNHNRLSAAGAGAPRRIRDLAQVVIDLDPALEEGGGYRILGRLHDQCPSVPLVSGWVSRQTALDSLRKAYAAFPDNAVNQLFLAEAILRHDPAHREEARAILARLASAPPRQEYRVEQAYYVALAQERLSSLAGP